MRLARMTLLISLLFGLFATAQTIQLASTTGNTETIVAQGGTPQQLAATTGSAVRLEEAASKTPIIIEVIDTSGTVSRTLPQIKQVARDILAAAPASSRFGVISVNTEAQKKMFQQRAEAADYIDTFKAAKSGFTDLNRATDAALTLIQGEGESRPTVIIYLTDGKLEVPKSFKDKSDFITVLRREFTPRPNLRVIVVRVNGGQLPKDTETLPPNVTFFPITNWAVAQAEVAKTLVPQIRDQLTAPTAPAEQTKQAPVTAAGETAPTLKTSLIIGGSLVLLLAGGAFLLQHRRRRLINVSDGVEALAEGEGPENLLTEADLKTALPEPKPAQMVLLEVERAEQHGLADDLPPGRRRIKMQFGERLVIGNTAIAADLYFTELKQTQTLELRLEKEATAVALKAYRLRPDAPGVLDAVLINGQPALKIFTLKNGDKLTIGSVVIRIIYADYGLLELLDNVSEVAEDEVEAVLPNVEPVAAPTSQDESTFTHQRMPPVFTPDERVSLRRRYGSERSRLDL